MTSTKIAIIIATGFGSGLFPKAPGTTGTIAATLVWWLFLAFYPSVFIKIAAILLVFIAGTIATHFYIKESSSSDPKEVVIDEWVGMWISCLSVSNSTDFIGLGLAFVFFRFFDISKLSLVGKAERLSGALGVMMDDVVAGIFSLAIMLIIKTYLI